MSGFSKPTTSNIPVYLHNTEEKPLDIENSADKISIAEIEKEFKVLFKEYNLEFSFEKLQKYFGDKYSKENLLNMLNNNSFALNNLIAEVDKKLYATFSLPKEDNVKSIDKILEQYSGKISSISSSEENNLAKELSLVLKNINDDDKIKYKDKFVAVFKNNPIILHTFFESFSDNKKATECADGFDFKTLSQEGYQEVLKVVAEHMSAPGANKLFKECGEEAYLYYSDEKHKAVIDSVYKNNLSDEERQTIIDSLPENEKAIISEYNRLTDICLTVTFGILKNENISQEDKEKHITESFGFFKSLPSGENGFLDSFAKILSNDSNEFSIDKTKLSELLDKISDNKYSEAVQKLSEKTAVDSETGMLKNKPEEVAASSKEKIEAIKQEIEANTPKEPALPQVESDSETSKQDCTPVPLLQTLGGTYGFEVLKDVITGKIKTQSKSEEHAAIESYKLLNTAMQGSLLQRSTGEFFNKLIDNTKTSTLKNLLSVGWKGRSVDITNRVEETIEERKDDVA